MSVTPASFRTDLSEFSDTSAYPTPAITYWIAIAQIMMGIQGASPPQICSFVGTIAGSVLTVDTINFGALSLLPLLLAGNSVAANSVILNQVTGSPGGPGTYNLNQASTVSAPAALVALQNAPTIGANPYWGQPSLTPDTPPTTIADFAQELFVAHQLVLEKQALDAAAVGGDPGTKIGVITSKSVGSVSVSFDVSSIVQKNAGYWSQTQYGIRFFRLLNLRGAGPIQLGIGRAPPFLFFNNWGLTGSYNAWAGPYPGIEQSDTGFG